MVEKHHARAGLRGDGIGQLVDSTLADDVLDCRAGQHDLDGGGSPRAVNSGDQSLAQDAEEQGSQPGLGQVPFMGGEKVDDALSFEGDIVVDVGCGAAVALVEMS